MAVTGGAQTDFWGSPVSRGIAMDFFVSTGFIGPVLGPISGTFITRSSVGWRWTMWITAIVTSSISICAFFFLPETYKPVLIERQTAKDRYEDPKRNMRNQLGQFKKGTIPFARDYLLRPLG